MVEKVVIEADDEQARKLKNFTLAVYVLQALACVGVGITFLVGVIVNYIKKNDVAGTWLESHFRWQMRTFWFAVLWTLVGAITAFFYIGIIVLVGTYIWIVYRIIKGWIRLADNKPMYDD